VDAAAQATEEIREALFSQDNLSEIPVSLNTQFYKLNDVDTKLSVLTLIDLKTVDVPKRRGRNLNTLTLVTALFDRDGKYVTATEKKLEFRLQDQSLPTLLASGIKSRVSFNVKPGRYVVRQVVRDAEGGQLTGLSRAIEIPF